MILSKTFLIIQGLILIWPSLLGLMLIFGSIVPFISGSFQAAHVGDFIVGVILFTFLISAWRVYIWVLLNGPKNEKRISSVWFVLCFVALILSIGSYFPYAYSHNKDATNFIYMNSQLFILGLIFLPTSIHVGFEWFWQCKLKAKSNS
jgi:hypothetical protein